MDCDFEPSGSVITNGALVLYRAAGACLPASS